MTQTTGTTPTLRLANVRSVALTLSNHPVVTELAALRAGSAAKNRDRLLEEESEYLIDPLPEDWRAQARKTGALHLLTRAETPLDWQHERPPGYTPAGIG